LENVLCTSVSLIQTEVNDTVENREARHKKVIRPDAPKSSMAAQAKASLTKVVLMRAHEVVL
jgi:hypothetical protein